MFDKAKELLKGADALLATEAQWIKGQWSNMVFQSDVHTPSCWCAWGAIVWLEQRESSRVRWRALDLLDQAAREHPFMSNKPYEGIINFNDLPETTFADVKAVYARALELAA